MSDTRRRTRITQVDSAYYTAISSANYSPNYQQCN